METGGLSGKQVADDLGGGASTPKQWSTSHRDPDVVSKEGPGLAQENDRLLKQETEIPNNGDTAFRGPKPMRVRFIE